jgi:tetratricopeptide (TPR) repeat protein
MGVLYARYGLMDKAEVEFAKVLDANDYLPTLINLGNMYYLRGQWYQALEYYQRASKKAPENPTVLLGIARVYHELENYKIVEKTYEQLKDKAPDIADRFAYLEMTKSEGVRSADVVRLKGIVLWEEE